MKVVTTLSKNKASEGDIYVLDASTCTVTTISKQYVHLSNGKQYPVKMFNSWVRLAHQMKNLQRAAEGTRKNAKKYLEEIKILRKEAKKDYDEKYKQPSKDYPGSDTTLYPYIILNGVADTKVHFYFSPTKKADAEDLEKSFRSLHGLGFKAFAQGYYIRYKNTYALIGMSSYKNRNLSEKRIKFALHCLLNTKIDGEKVNVSLYKDLTQMLSTGKMSAEMAKLLSSTPESEFAKELKETSSEPEKKHWSGLNGDIAQDQVDVGLENMYRSDAPEDDYPF